MRTLAISTLALVAFATPAIAQDAEFTGPRAEVTAGWDHVGAYGDGESGFGYGGVLGYDKQVGQVVIGAEAAVAGSTIDAVGRDLYVGGRIGVATSGVLAYAKGGLTNARFIGYNTDGYRFGGGVEKSFGKFYGKIEYTYSRYEELELNRDQVVAGVGIRF